MDLRKILAREMAKGNNKMLPNSLLGSLTSDMEWIKWLSFQTEKQKILKKKEKNFLTDEDRKELDRYLEEDRIASLLKLYGSNKITISEYLECYDFIRENDIEKYLLSKLTKEELEVGREKIKYYNEVSLKDLRNKIKTDIENYQILSMVDAFVLHYIIKINIKKEVQKVEREIDSQIKRNQYTHQLGLHYAKNSFVNK